MGKKTNDVINDNWNFPRLWAGFLLFLCGGTYPLWLASDQALAVPMVGAAQWVPPAVTVALVMMLCVSSCAVASAPSPCRRLWWVIAALLLALFVLDQHRLQPWAYQTMIYALVFASMSESLARRWLLPLAASVYIYSALGKLDYQFAHTVGIDFLEMITAPVGGLKDDLTISTRARIALLFPAVELSLGVLLLPRRTRRVAGLGVMGMHAALLGVLGPWGLNHSYGVLIWNALLLVQAWILFVSSANGKQNEEATPQRLTETRGAVIARVVIVVALVMPCFERRGWWDHWLSWALYSPHSSRCEIQVHRSGIKLLDPEMREFVSDDTDGDGWHTLALERWSLERRKVPIYPQARYQLGLAIAVVRSSSIDDQMRGRLRGVSDRRSGKRSERPLLGRTEMERAANQFWLIPHNAK